MSNTDAIEVLEFWFGDASPDLMVAPPQSQRWFKKDASFDAEIIRRFTRLTELALEGELDAWRDSAATRRAYVIVLDQFARNIFRDSGRAFAGDERALSAAAEGLARGEDEHLGPQQRAFLYMPYMHSEDLHHQNASVALFTVLAGRFPVAESFLKFAKLHRDVIAQFGRFPHRNDVLDRRSTPDEDRYLAQPGSGF